MSTRLFRVTVERYELTVAVPVHPRLHRESDHGAVQQAHPVLTPLLEPNTFRPPPRSPLRPCSRKPVGALCVLAHAGQLEPFASLLTQASWSPLHPCSRGPVGALCVLAHAGQLEPFASLLTRASWARSSRGAEVFSSLVYRGIYPAVGPVTTPR
eukprot:116478-Prorocentrum_minimum.AAC.1